MTVLAIELRCPVGPRKLLAKVRTEGLKPIVVEGNLLELACRDCTRALRVTEPDVRLVVHSYDLAGTLVESHIDRGS